MLHCGEATVAFDCLIQTVQNYQVNPRLWLRLAECCIMANKAVSKQSLLSYHSCEFAIIMLYHICYYHIIIIRSNDCDQ